MIRKLLEKVEIGILDNYGKFVMTPFIYNTKNYFSGEVLATSQKFSKVKIKCWKIINRGDKLVIKIYTMDNMSYTVNSFSTQYLQYLRKFCCNVTELIAQCKADNTHSFNKCRISDVSIFAKFSKMEILMPPIEGKILYASGNITGHKCLKRGFGKTSKLTDINFYTCTIKSLKSVYGITSISQKYQEYLEIIISYAENILKYFQK
jgi:hypothetical protein